MSFHRVCTNSLLSVCYVNIDCTSTETGMFTTRLCLGLFSYFRTKWFIYKFHCNLYLAILYRAIYRFIRYSILRYCSTRFPDFPCNSIQSKYHHSQRKSHKISDHEISRKSLKRFIKRFSRLKKNTYHLSSSKEN